MGYENDPILKSIVMELREKFNCHTIVLYGSRARGSVSPTSDYDVVGVRRRGKKTRLAKKQMGFYWDVFVYSERDLKKLGSPQLGWRDAKILYQEGTYGRNLLSRLQTLFRKPHKPEPQYEIDILKVWAQKELDRCKVKDIQGLYRRAEFQNALIEHYFVVRKKRFSGPKAGFAWLEKNDLQTFKLIQRSLKHPTNLSFLGAAASRVYKVPIR
jgi:predicted nucleotidyltransferase